MIVGKMAKRLYTAPKTVSSVPYFRIHFMIPARGVGQPWSPALRWIYAPSENKPDCETTARPFDCAARPMRAKYETMPITFTCDLESLLWRYDYTGQLIIGYGQQSWDHIP